MSIDYIFIMLTINKIRSLFFIIIFILISKNIFADPFTIIDHKLWKEVPPSEMYVNFYDKLFLETVPRAWKNYSPHGGNLGTAIGVEVMIWEGKNYCAMAAYDRVYDPDWAGGTYVLGANFESLFEQNTNSKKVPYYKEKCALYDPDSPEPGRTEGYNERVENIGKRVGMKGHQEPVRTQRFDYINPVFQCMIFTGGLGTSKWTLYEGGLYYAGIFAHLCVEDESYFTKTKIKTLARSLGIVTDESHSLKLNADPPKDLTLDLSKFTKVTGKRNDYSVSVILDKKENKLKTSTAKKNESIYPNDTELSLEKKLKKLKKLFEQDLITKEEYTEKKQEILDDL